MELPADQREGARPTMRAVAKLTLKTKTRSLAEVAVRTHKEGLMLERVFPYPLVKEDGTCEVCRKPFKEHKYVVMFVNDAHVANAATWFDQKTKAVNQVEVILEIFARGTTDKMVSEKERVEFLERMRSAYGPEVAEEWQLRLHYQTQEGKLTYEILNGAKIPLTEVQNLYDSVRARLKLLELFDYKDDGEEFIRHYDR